MPKVVDITSAGRGVSILVVEVTCPECKAGLVPVTDPPTRIHVESAVLIANEAGRLVRCPECEAELVLTTEAVLSVLERQAEGVSVLECNRVNRRTKGS
jgi:uncharacterized protein with PIN domain